ncbi:MAG: hydrogenase maturation protease [Desulfobacterales bacterium]|nr:hydrogenase maturation protease [Desulfobacterales bacterium]
MNLPYLEKDCLILGCGNPLLGDDGFGPEVIQRLETHYRLPDFAFALDVGTAIRDILFDMLLAAKRPHQLIVVDAMDLGDAQSGAIHEIRIDQMQAAKIVDYSLHQFPTTNMLQELAEGTAMDVRLLVAQVGQVPDMVQPGLSLPIRRAVDRMCAKIVGMVSGKAILAAGGGHV